MDRQGKPLGAFELLIPAPDVPHPDGLAGDLERSQFWRRNGVVQVLPEHPIPGPPLNLHAGALGMLRRRGQRSEELLQVVEEASPVLLFGEWSWVAAQLHRSFGEKILEIGEKAGGDRLLLDREPRQPRAAFLRVGNRSCHDAYFTRRLVRSPGVRFSWARKDVCLTRLTGYEVHCNIRGFITR